MAAASVLVPIDLSAPARFVLPLAARLGQIVAVHIRPGPAWVDPLATSPRQDHARDVAASDLRALLLDSDVHGAEALADVGRPAQRIVHWATERRADLIVMASHGRTGLPRLLLGSVAERVLRLCPCPVWVVKEEAASVALSSGAPRLLVAVDLADPGAQELVETAVPWALTLGGTIHLVHVLHGVDALHADGASLRESRDEVLAKLHGTIPSSVRGESHLLSGEPREALAELAEGYELVVIGSHGRNAFARILLGSTCEAIARMVPAVAVVPISEEVLLDPAGIQVVARSEA